MDPTTSLETCRHLGAKTAHFIAFIASEAGRCPAHRTRVGY